MIIDNEKAMAEAIAQRVSDQGGTAYYVGGFVRDRLLGCENKDIDMEVHGITPDQLEAILQQLGEPVTMGSSFGIWGLRHCGLDIAMPRRETATGRGHRDFSVYVDPFLGEERAASRRDFTVNAFMENILTGEILDFFGGKEDLEKGILRHVNGASFGEDPLRVFRAAQFAARFEFSIADETVEICRTMDLSALPGERVFCELEKALLKSKHPSIFFRVLREMDQLKKWFPEVEALIGVEQNPKYHPEGDVWNHTMLVLDAAAALREQASDPRGFMFSALCHDFGKPLTTHCVDGVIRSIGHEKKGLPEIERWLSRLCSESNLHRYVMNMTALHMRPNACAAQSAGPKATAKLFDEAIVPEDLVLLAKADRMGQSGKEQNPEAESFLRERLEQYRELMAQPFVAGKDLVMSGLHPGPEFSAYLAYAHKLRLAGVPRELALKQTLAYARGTEKTS